ncbi:MAG: response regulator transcription factor [Ilumatobacteraceae bacterium]
MTAPLTRVGVVTDSAVHGTLWSRVLGHEDGIEVVTAVTGIEALDVVRDELDVVLVDLPSLGDTARAARALHDAWPEVAVAVVEVGVPMDILIERVRTAGSTMTVLSSAALTAARGQLRTSAPRSPASAYPRLTEREREVLECLSRGNSTASIAADLRMSVHTCRGHLRTLMAKLGARSQLEVLAFVAEHGLPGHEGS